MSAANPLSVLGAGALPYSFPLEEYAADAPFIKSLLPAEPGLKKPRRAIN